ncbi:hypothetical protein ACJIZ3_005477 [Penstemon smallii]|uniref:Uncharacterized protein n=1 Tax=Penstemon smallii TaxID=265156 RepID=A0ABD3S539_9LAMI
MSKDASLLSYVHASHFPRLLRLSQKDKHPGGNMQ